MTAQLAQETAVALFVVFMMITVGIDLTIDRIGEVFRHPGILLRGMMHNYLVVPAVALGLCHLFEVPPLWGAGILFAAMAPGGPVGAVLTQKAGGNLALAVSMVVTMNILNIGLTPLYIWATDAASFEGAEPFPFGGMIKTILFFQLLPLAAAMAWRHLYTESALRCQPAIDKASRFVLIAVVVFIFITQAPKSAGLDPSILLTIIGVGAVSIGGGWLLSGSLHSNNIAVAMTSGIRSMSLTLLLLAAWFPRPEAILSALTFSGATVGMACALAFAVQRRAARRAPGP